MTPRRTYSPETDAAIIEYKQAGWKNRQIAEALGITPIALEHYITRRRRQGWQGPFRERPAMRGRQKPADAPIDGETWLPVPSRGLSLSSQGRVVSLRSGYLRSVFKQAGNGAPTVNYETQTSRGTITLENLRREALGAQAPTAPMPAIKCARPPARRSVPKPGIRKCPQFEAWEDDFIWSAASSRCALFLLPHRDLKSVQRRARALGVFYPESSAHHLHQAQPIEGETWVEIPSRLVAISSNDRVISMKTGRLLRPFLVRGRPTISILAGGKRTSATVKLLRYEALGLHPPRRRDRWRAEEDRALSRSRTLADARAALPDRTVWAIKGRAKHLRKSFGRAESYQPLARGSIPWDDPHYKEALKIVPRSDPDHEELVTEITAMMYLGFNGTYHDALKAVRKERNRQSNRYRDVSLFAPMQGTDSRCYADTIASDREHF